MGNYPTFADYLGWRAASGGGHVGDLGGRSRDAGSDRLAERSLFGGLFKAVNPSRPVGPWNSRLVASPWRKRLKGQVMGR
jgi:hypothetical protein